MNLNWSKVIRTCFTALAVLIAMGVNAQVKIGENGDFGYNKVRDFEIGGITVSGTENFDTKTIILYSGLSVGERIKVPGEKISKAIRNLWDQKLFSDIHIYSAEIRGDKIYLNIDLKERPRMSRFKFTGVSKSEADKLRDKIKLIRGSVVNQNLLTNTTNIIRKYYVKKGYRKTKVDIEQTPDTVVSGGTILTINVHEGPRVKINDIQFKGVTAFKPGRLRRAMKKTKKTGITHIFTSSKLLPDKFEDDEQKIIDLYNENGYRNAKIVGDSIWDVADNKVDILIRINEGHKFYFRNIRWIGNTKYSSDQLTQMLGITRGEVYNKKKFDSHLFMNQNGGDVSSLYLDDGYLAFQAVPLEEKVEGDSIDIEIRIYEGRQYRVNRITVTGNTKTNDRVIRREIRTKPGDLFSRSDVIRTQRELSNLGYFDPEAFQVTPNQNDQNGTVDIDYKVSERPSDQVELSGGWGAGTIVGTLGLSFTNFSLRNIFKPDAWRPLPSGDGQKLSLRAQTNGTYYQAYSFSFTEPWLGGKKPNSFSLGLQHSIQTSTSTDINGRNGRLAISGGSVGLGKRLEWPDDYFQIYAGVSYLYYNLQNFAGYFAFSNGHSNNASVSLDFSRNSVFDPIYPRYGSNVKLSLQATPPYSLFDGISNYSNISDAQRYKWIEYYKWKFTAEWYTEVEPKLVAMVRTGFGYLGYYNRSKGLSPFERFYLGGTAISGYQLDGRELIGLRGYDDQVLSPTTGANFITKTTLELRYPMSLNPSATIYALGFLDAGATSVRFQDTNPFQLYRSGGVGLRIFLPMFGLLGVDYGWRFDDVPGHPGMAPGRFTFTIGANLGEL